MCRSSRRPRAGRGKGFGINFGAAVGVGASLAEARAVPNVTASLGARTRSPQAVSRCRPRTTAPPATGRRCRTPSLRRRAGVQFTATRSEAETTAPFWRASGLPRR
jgi:hypothetical protein